ncbi:hypothetical protein M8C21_013363, partial [Ambrosia artemisiifolia]
ELELNWRLLLATVIGFLGYAFGTVGGIGGGGSFVLMPTLIVGFYTKSTAALSKCKEKIERERTRMQEEESDLPIDEEECLTRVLGSRRGWTRGIGRKVRKVGPDVSCVVNSPSQAEHYELKETVRLLTQSVQHLTAKVNKMENQGCRNKIKMKMNMIFSLL